jgi:hypothetical protein
MTSDVSNAKYPHIRVELSKHDGNAFGVLAAVEREMRRANLSREEILKFRDEATSGDYDHLLATAMRWVECV